MARPSKKFLKACVQVPKGLLNGDRGDITQPRILFLQIRQHGRESVIVELLTKRIGSLTGIESPIVHEAATSERLRKKTLLFVSRIEPIFICPLLLTHCLFAFLVFYIALNGLNRDTSHRADKEAASIPMPEGQGFYAAIDKQSGNMPVKSGALRTSTDTPHSLIFQKRKM